MKTEIAPLLIVIKLEQYDYAGAAAIAPASCSRISFALLLADQRAAGLAGRTAGRRMTADATSRRRAARGAARAGDAASRSSPSWRCSWRCSCCCRWSSVFAEAFAAGPRRLSSRAIDEPDALAAIRLTLLVAAIAVPLNAVFGVAAAWAIAKFELPRQEPAAHPDRPAVLGLAGGRRA